MHEKEHLKSLHISILAIWDMGRNRGRVSTYLPLKTFVDRGHEVYFLTSAKGQQVGNIDGVKVRKLKTIISPSNKGIWKFIITYLHLPMFMFSSILYSLLISVRRKPDMVYAHDIYSALPAYIISKLLGCKYVFRAYGFYKPKVILTKIIPYIAFHLSADLYIITNDGTFGHKVLKKYGIRRSKVCFWINGVDKRWVNKPIDYDLRKGLAKEGEKLVLSLCRLVPWKQVGILIRAIPRIIERHTDVKFIIVGDGEQRTYLEKLARDLKICNFVKFEGAVGHTRAIDYIKICDVFVSMNGLSSICNPVLEAMTCGKAVIALDTGATSDLIRNGENGILVNIQEEDKLPVYILSVLEDNNYNRRLGRNAEKFILANWPTWEERVNLEADLIETLCSGGDKKIIEIKNKADGLLDLRSFNRGVKS